VADQQTGGQINAALIFGEVARVAQGEIDNLEMKGTAGAITLHNLTTTQRDALTAANGMIIYNTTDSKVQVRESGSWNNVI
jgi:hypothetical protein